MRRPSFFWLGLAAVLLLVGLIGGRSREDGPPLDPDSTGALGTRALTELVEAFGSDVRRGLPRDETTTALVLADRLGDGERGEIRRWVEGGGTLVVADPGSPLSPALADLTPEDELAAGRCSISGLTDLTLVGSSFGRYESDSGEESCFGEGDLAHVVSESVGAGRIVSLGGAIVFTNQNLDEGDNAVLAVELLADKGGEMAVVYDAAAAVGTRSLTDLIPERVRWFGWQLLLAFAVYLLWRVRRFGRVVLEPQLVEMPGSLLVRASGELARRSAGHGAAAERLSSDLERRLRRQFRIAPDAGPGHLIETVVARTDVDAGVLGRALAPAIRAGDPAASSVDGDTLVALLVDIDSVDAACLPSSLPTPAVGGEPDPAPEGVQYV